MFLWRNKKNYYLDTSFINLELRISTWERAKLRVNISSRSRLLMISRFYKTDDRLWNSGLFPTLLSTYRIFNCCRIYSGTTKVLIRLCGFAWRSESLLFPYAPKAHKEWGKVGPAWKPAYGFTISASDSHKMFWEKWKTHAWFHSWTQINLLQTTLL